MREWCEGQRMSQKESSQKELRGMERKSIEGARDRKRAEEGI